LLTNSRIISLIKQQVEAGREQVGKKEIVHDRNVHVDVLEKTLTYARHLGYSIHGLTFSPVTGGDGNIEFLAHLGWKSTSPVFNDTRTGLKQFVENTNTHFQIEN